VFRHFKAMSSQRHNVRVASAFLSLLWLGSFRRLCPVNDVLSVVCGTARPCHGSASESDGRDSPRLLCRGATSSSGWNLCGASPVLVSRASQDTCTVLQRIAAQITYSQSPTLSQPLKAKVGLYCASHKNWTSVHQLPLQNHCFIGSGGG